MDIVIFIANKKSLKYLLFFDACSALKTVVISQNQMLFFLIFYGNILQSNKLFIFC